MMIESKYNRYTLPPHITHLLFPMFADKFEEAKPKVVEFMKNLKPFNIRFGDLVLDENRNLFIVNLESSELRKLHSDLLELASPYRDEAVREKDIEKYNKDGFEGKSLEYLQKYGYSRVLDLNNPHITIGNVEVENIDIKKVESEIRVELTNVLNKDWLCDKATIMLHTNASKYQEFKILYEKEFILNQ